MVLDYTGFNFNIIDNLEVFEFWLYLRDAVVYKYMQTEEGRKYLENCWRIEQTKPDRKSIRNKMKEN